MPADMERSEDIQFDRILGVDLKGVWLCMKYELPEMLRVGGGAIVNVMEKMSPGDPRKAEEQYYLARIPMGRLGAPEECGRAITWLLSEEASYVNGCVMTVDGGVMAGQ